MKLAISSCGAPLTSDFFCRCKRAGIEAVEISMGRDQINALDIEHTKSLADEHGIRLCSLHIPFGPFNEIDPSRPELADATLGYFCSLIEKGASVGIKTFVVHASGEPIDEGDRARRMNCAKQTLARLAEYADGFGATVAVEDLPRTCLGRDSSDILELISAHPSLRVCFDTNHLLGEHISEFIKKVGRFIVTTHVSDYDAINERHWLPGEGVIDWPSLRSSLAGVGYDGYWLYELGLATPKKTIERHRSLEYSDIKVNFDQIMSGKAPSPFGVAKKNLPMWP